MQDVSISMPAADTHQTHPRSGRKVALATVVGLALVAIVGILATGYFKHPHAAVDATVVSNFANADSLALQEANNEAVSLGGAFSKSGHVDVAGRRINFKVSGKLSKFKWRYQANAHDAATGIGASSGKTKSGKGAVKEAIERVFKELVARGIVVIPVPDVPEGDIPMIHAEANEVADDVDVSSTILGGAFSKSGHVDVAGRRINFKVSGHVKKLKWVYSASAHDAATGIGASSGSHKSPKTAVKVAVEGVFNELMARGIVPVPSSIPESDIPL